MYSILLASAIAAVLSGAGMALDWWGWGWAVFFFFPIIFVASSILIVRRIGKQLEPGLSQLRKLMEQQSFALAMQNLKDMLPKARWIPMVHGQLVAQMGVLAYQQGKLEEAIGYLKQAPSRAADAKVFLASVQYRDGDKKDAFQTLDRAAIVNKKHPLLHNLRAWLLVKEGRREEAIAALAGYVQKGGKTDEIGKSNLLRLQNKNKMSMKDFGMFWFMLGFEQPPREMGQMRQARKGFRTPPMRKS
jgi:tetratricopeptide (TPR) repeat protein